jgi:Phosphate-induced protein 1 conserved region/WSC domain
MKGKSMKRYLSKQSVPLPAHFSNVQFKRTKSQVFARRPGLLTRLFLLPAAIALFTATAYGQIVATSDSPAAGSTSGIEYHGGPILANPNVYFIWYGNWSNNSALSILPGFISELSGSAYFNTDSLYPDSTGATVSNRVVMANQVFDSYSQGASLTDQGVRTIVNQQLQSGSLPTDQSGVYFVLTSSDVDVSGFCTQFCGYHSHTTLNGADIKYSFVGNIDRCPSKCTTGNLGPGPNGNLGADAMANVITHELNETVTDPDLNAWYHLALNGEVGDLCNFNFGPTFTTGNGAPANITLLGRNFLIQRNWINLGSGYCGMISKPTPPTPVYPYDGLLHVSSNFPVRWNDGLGGTLADPNHPVTYAIYYKYWPYSGTEPANYTLATAAQQCNPDSPGICSTAVSGEPDGTFRWYLEADLDTSPPPHTTPSLVRTQSSVATFTVGYQPINTIPPPLPPTPVYPYDGLQGVGSDFPVRWNDGLDASRRNGQYPTTYAIYYKYWPFGGVEPSSYTLVVAAQPCNARMTGICETYVTGEPNGNFRWFVIANMDVSLFTGVPNSILSTQSSVATFTVGQAVTYQGCYTDDPNRALPVQLMSTNATVESCTQAGFNNGYRYVGLQYYGECWAGNAIGYALDSPAQCNTPCSANSGETCGGVWHNSIWSTGR